MGIITFNNEPLRFNNLTLNIPEEDRCVFYFPMNDFSQVKRNSTHSDYYVSLFPTASTTFNSFVPGIIGNTFDTWDFTGNTSKMGSNRLYMISDNIKLFKTEFSINFWTQRQKTTEPASGCYFLEFTLSSGKIYLLGWNPTNTGITTPSGTNFIIVKTGTTSDFYKPMEIEALSTNNMTAPPNTIWTMITLSKSGDTLNIYDNTTLRYTFTGATALENNSNLWISGFFRPQTYYSNDYALWGYMDQLRLYTFGLDDTEISYLYNGGSGR